MATVKELVAALLELNQDEEIYYNYWTREDINGILKEREGNHAPVTTEEWQKFVLRMNSDDPLAHSSWEAADEYMLRLVEERRIP